MVSVTIIMREQQASAEEQRSAWKTQLRKSAGQAPRREWLLPSLLICESNRWTERCTGRKRWGEAVWTGIGVCKGACVDA